MLVGPAGHGDTRARRTHAHGCGSFVADASHELRTPLTSIRGFAELFRQGAASEPEQLAQAAAAAGARQVEVRDDGAGTTTTGSGLGLSIVAALVAAHGGTVTVDSTPGQGLLLHGAAAGSVTGGAPAHEEGPHLVIGHAAPA